MLQTGISEDTWLKAEITAVGHREFSGGSEVGRTLLNWYVRKVNLIATWRQHWLGRCWGQRARLGNSASIVVSAWVLRLSHNGCRGNKASLNQRNKLVWPCLVSFLKSSQTCSIWFLTMTSFWELGAPVSGVFPGESSLLCSLVHLSEGLDGTQRQSLHGWS